MTCSQNRSDTITHLKNNHDEGDTFLSPWTHFPLSIARTTHVTAQENLASDFWVLLIYYYHILSHGLDQAGTSLTAILKVFCTESIRTSISRHPWSRGHLVMQPFLYLHPAATLHNSQWQREQWQPNAHFHWTSSCFSASAEAQHRTGNSL